MCGVTSGSWSPMCDHMEPNLGLVFQKTHRKREADRQTDRQRERKRKRGREREEEEALDEAPRGY